MTTDENNIVLDPFSGTGTTAISAKRLGRKYIGFELDTKYVEISQEKLEHTKSNFKIDDSWVSFYLKDIVTIRNNDWNNLEKHFIIPKPLRSIDYERAKLKDKKLIPDENGVALGKQERGPVLLLDVAVALFSRCNKLKPNLTQL